jgi:adenosyl cobinamide kinase/adenosyl cobinamide phosphate guanylyltransferase
MDAGRGGRVSLLLLLGGARSGKSALALRLAEDSGAPVVFVATGEALDDEMRQRIERHRAERAADWRTVEEPVELRTALDALPEDACAVVDCLSFWVANLLERGLDAAAVEAEAAAAAHSAAARVALTIAVSNEVGLGIVPSTPLGRAYRDLLGRVNQAWAARAERVGLVVAGRVLPLREASEL